MNKNKESGQLLLEILVAVAAVVVIATLGAQLILVGGKSVKTAGDRDAAAKLVEETFVAVRSIATENWQTIYAPVDGKGSSHLYHPEQLTGKWVFGSIEVVPINNVNYTRSFYIENVSRDANNNITLTAGTDDPSTQKVTVSVSWPGGNAITNSEYITRWRGKGCVQTDWSGGSGGSESPCTTNTYEASDGIIDTSDGEIKLP